MDILFLLIPLSLLLVFAIIQRFGGRWTEGNSKNIEKYGDEILHDDDSVHAETKQ